MASFQELAAQFTMASQSLDEATAAIHSANEALERAQSAVAQAVESGGPSDAQMILQGIRAIATDTDAALLKSVEVSTQCLDMAGRLMS